MKNTLFLTAVLIMTATTTQAKEVVVGGQRIHIPNKYKKTYVEVKANECLSSRLTELQTDAAVAVVALDCTNAVLRNIFFWEKKD